MAKIKNYTGQARAELKEERIESIKDLVKARMREIDMAKETVKRLEAELKDLLEKDETEIDFLE